MFVHYIAIHRVNHYPTEVAVRWIEIYPVDSVIQLLNTWASITIFFYLWQRRIYHHWKEQHGLLKFNITVRISK